MNKPLLQLLLTRITLAAVTLFAVSIVVFAATQYLPGDPARAALGAKADPSAVEALRREFGMDRPAVVQYASWIGGALTGDFGRSIPSGRSVWEAIGPRAVNTLILTVTSLLLLIPLSFVLGIAAAIYKDRLADHLISVPTIVTVALPEFVIGTVLIVLFAVYLRWLPPVSLINDSLPLSSQTSLFILPVLTLLGTTLAQVVRMVRAVALEVLSAEYIYMVRLRGISPARVLLRHVLPNTITPTIQTIALNAAWLAGGVVVTESVFQLPGIGSALSEAVINRDMPTVLAITLIITATYVLINLVSEALILLLNPRLRVARGTT
ncbi:MULTISPECIES: ABC transporter permease [unclassified Mesorhizobium]|uniref:ABC transporter permease n=1 Tax=unclassified Mesorhizobium TaxID=325217 RepID=UPI000FD851AE|nr:MULTISPECIES: ABC transporter permease [unclassified Mesorhizobium]TGQ05012.1 ABC transporter permease [Mesorhizobium sp. M2E.F.Ca.ET.219.01.1.1]TGS14311.1 ABC transporter permease [Mesorhizobium sp. M2E.F.Ca.ET.209.01.1.1]TGT65546.1 ABC transporter permease [Mesorhizobium sp. M2E.F.Ca.ET.166.01.1.1]TGV97593.1 ABC transporter permease [Mesorhizobium sp. M2E.F.Ca.ET.154.01.1.1]